MTFLLPPSSQLLKSPDKGYEKGPTVYDACPKQMIGVEL